MSLLESIKADEEALAKLQEVPKEDVVEVKEDPADEPVDEPKEEPKEVPKETPKEEPKPDASAYAKMRIEKAQAEAKARDAEEKLKAYEERLSRLEKASQPEEEPEEKVTVELPPEVQKLVYEQKKQAAKEHFGQYEREFIGSGEVPDYEPVIQGYAVAMYKSLSLTNPNLSLAEIDALTEQKILEEASMYHNARLNPAEEMYKRAKSLGIQAPKEEPKEDFRKPNLDRVAENKKRSSGMASAGSSSSDVTTLQAAVDMPLGQFAAISPAELRRLEEAARR